MTTTTTYTDTRPELSLGDNLEQRFALNFGESNWVLGASVGARTLRGHGFIAVDYGYPAGYFNSAVLTEPPTVASLTEIDGFYAAGTTSARIYSPWPIDTRDLPGWELAGYPPFMVRSSGLGTPHRRSDLEIVPVGDLDTVRDWERVVIDGFPFAEAVPGSVIGPAVLTDPRLLMWVGYQQGRPVAVGTAFAAFDVVSFMLGVTIPEARGRGYWHDMASTRIASNPNSTFVSINSDDSQPGARGIGFLPVSRWHVWKKQR